EVEARIAEHVAETGFSLGIVLLQGVEIAGRMQILREMPDVPVARLLAGRDDADAIHLGGRFGSGRRDADSEGDSAGGQQEIAARGKGKRVHGWVSWGCSQGMSGRELSGLYRRRRASSRKLHLDHDHDRLSPEHRLDAAVL